MDGNILLELYSRFKTPWCTSFVLYFVLVVVLFGGTGVWLPIMKDGSSGMQSLSMNLLTYSCAIIVPAWISVILSMLDYKNKVSLILFVVSSLIFVVFAVGEAVYNDNLICSVICCVLALFFWVVANYNNTELSDDKFNESIKSKVESLSDKW